LESCALVSMCVCLREGGGLTNECVGLFVLAEVEEWNEMGGWVI
jgi:hypothetical protein